MKDRLLVLSRYSRMGASSRLRALQYRPWFENAGFEVEHAALFDDAYLQKIYSGRKPKANLLTYYGKRVSQLRRAGQADLLWLEKESLPWLPWSIERALLPRGTPLIVDYDDAVFHHYDLHRSALIRQLLGQKLDDLMASASLVTAGNRYLSDRATAAGAARVEIVPTVVDLTAYTRRHLPFSNKCPKIGWIGTPSTWTAYMAPLMSMFVQAAEDATARMIVVGAGRAATAHPLLDNLSWTEDSEVARIHQMDIGIMPLADTPWARGKSGYKLIQYMACGIPVIASPVGVNAHIVEHGVNGFHASSDTEWAEALRTLLHDPELRAKMGQEGRRKIERDYSLQIWGPRLAQMLRHVADEGRSN